jgi:hypothetical protein
MRLETRVRGKLQHRFPFVRTSHDVARLYPRINRSSASLRHVQLGKFAKGTENPGDNREATNIGFVWI